MSKISISKHHSGFEAVFTFKDNGSPEIFHGIGKNKKSALQDLRNNLAKHLRNIESTRNKIMKAMQEADGIIHTPALLNGDK